MFLLLFLASGADVTAPTMSSGTFAANGTDFTTVFSEACETGAGGTAGLTLTPTNGGAAVTLTYASGTGTSSWVWTASRAVTRNETFTRTYVQPGNGIQDMSGLDLASFSDQAVTNNSTQNTTPTDLTLSNTSVSTTGGLNAVVGSLSTTDPDPGDTFTYTLVAGTGDVDNFLFDISGANLICLDPSGLTPGEYFVRIQTSDGVGTRAEAFTIQVVEPGGASVYSFNSFLSDFFLRF